MGREQCVKCEPPCGDNLALSYWDCTVPQGETLWPVFLNLLNSPLPSRQMQVLSSLGSILVCLAHTTPLLPQKVCHFSYYSSVMCI